MSVDYAETGSGLLVPTNVRGLKFGTPRDPSRPTLGGLQGAFSEVWLRRRLMPHQQYIADVCGEVLPSGLPAYTMCLITFQRQGGKSALAMAQTGERCFTRPGFHAWYTAQKRKDARDQFLAFADDVVADTPLALVVDTLRGNGTEVMKFPRSSWLRPHEPSEESLHGKQSDRNDIDEAWAFSLERGEALIQAIGPTQVTRPGAQTFIWSAGGTAASTWLAALVARGRALVGGGTNAATLDAAKDDPLRGQRLAFFELGIPDDSDPEDLEVIAEHHPAYEHTVSMASLEALRTTFGSDSAGWARAAGNRWTEVIGGSIDARLWSRAAYPEPIDEENGEALGWGVARAEDGSMVALAAATYVDDPDDGRVIVVEVVDVMPGAYGASERVREWIGRDVLAIDPSGPSASLADDLDGVLDDEHLVKMTARNYSAACANVVDALAPRAYRYRPNVHLDAAVRIVGKRNVADGGFVWARLTSGAPTAPLEAATLAVWALTHRPADGKAATEWV